MIEQMENLSPIEKKALSAFKDKLIHQHGNEVLELRLFGSRARSQGDEESDLDIAVVVSEENGKLRRNIYDLAYDISLASGVNLSPLVISAKKLAWLNSIERAIALDIEREGVKL